MIWSLFFPIYTNVAPFLLQAAEGETRGETDHWRSPGSSLAKLHRGPGQRAAFCSDDDGQSEQIVLRDKWGCFFFFCSAKLYWTQYSPQSAFDLCVLLSQAVVAGIQQAHAEQLASMRIQDMNISLKPLNSVNNPILRKRKLLGYS